jgi:oligoribonuclease
MIAWIDLETTGLDTECAIIEVACVVTDDKFNEVDSYQSLVGLDGSDYIQEGALKMHRKSGLWNLVCAEEKTIMQVDRELAAVLDRHCVVETALILGGQSVHFDRGFIERWMPQSNTMLSHRQIDVSGLKLFVALPRDIDVNALPPLKSKTTHRAMDDIRASIEAAKWYWRALKFEPPTVRPPLMGRKNG